MWRNPRLNGSLRPLLFQCLALNICGGSCRRHRCCMKVSHSHGMLHAITWHRHERHHSHRTCKHKTFLCVCMAHYASLFEKSFEKVFSIFFFFRCCKLLKKTFFPSHLHMQTSKMSKFIKLCFLYRQGLSVLKNYKNYFSQILQQDYKWGIFT